MKPFALFFISIVLIVQLFGCGNNKKIHTMITLNRQAIEETASAHMESTKEIKALKKSLKKENYEIQRRLSNTENDLIEMGVQLNDVRKTMNSIISNNNLLDSRIQSKIIPFDDKIKAMSNKLGEIRVELQRLIIKLNTEK